MNNPRSIWKSWLPLAATIIVLGLAYSPLLTKFFRSLWQRSHYQYFPFVLGAFAWLIWQRSQQATPREDSKRGGVGLLDGALIAAAWALLGIAYYAHSPWLAAVSAVVLAASFLVRLSRDRIVSNVWGIWFLLWLIIPLPTHPDQQLIAVLQRWSSRLSSILLDSVGIPHLMSGNVLQLEEKQLFVDEACSGIVSVLSIVSCAVIYSVWNNRAPIHLVLLTVAGIGWATLMNVTRISTIAFAFDTWGVDWSEGPSHEMLGLAMFTLTFLALVCTDILLLGAMSPIASAWAKYQGEALKYGQRVIAFWDRLLQWGAPERDAKQGSEVANVDETQMELPTLLAWNKTHKLLGIAPLLAFGILGGMQYVYGDWLFDLERRQSLSSQNLSVLDNAFGLKAEVLPVTYDSFNRTTFQAKERETDNVFGKYSRTYEYRDVDDNLLLVSCDYPFSGGWHELAICYQGIGWQETDRRIVTAAGSREKESWNYVEEQFSGRDGSKAFLAFCFFDEYGLPVDPPTFSIFDYIWQRLTRPVGSAQGRQLFQVQIWTTSLGDVSEEERESVQDLLLDARERFRDFIIKGNP